MRRRTKLIGGFATITVAVAVALIPGDARSTTTPLRAVRTAVQSREAEVTLITGDRVRVRTANGRSTVTAEPALRTGALRFLQFTRGGDQYVLPAEAAGLVRDGKLDLALFNVTGLIRQGYDDAHTATVPLLVRYSNAKKAAVAPAGGKVRRALAHAGMTALDEQKSSAATFWSQVKTADTRKIWLNGKVHVDLDQSVPQIGAPVAWSHGLTGAGQTVAVLDTGIDTQHADFAGRIGATKDFSGKGNVEDGFGHGTHVASIVAGSGAASGGKYKGVAPDATLAVGKVLDDGGSGTYDELIAGMQWAAADLGAKVVNMSLGGDPSDGNDPMSAALNTLTAQYGTLFVVAAGNFGGDGTVTSPGAADAALTVSSVSKSDVPSRFSSRGPRIGDGAAKPDLAAPGEDIAAARAAAAPLLGEPVGDAYQRLSGTSMATPHVAGSAALLSQEHPDWHADQLKAALMSTATEVSGAGPYAVGTGRVDVARATTQAVTATGSVSAFLPWPNQGAAKKLTVSWHNTGKDPVTLGLSSSLTGRFSLSADSVTVPAGGDASVEVTTIAQDGASGHFSGVLTGRSAGGAVSTRTTLSAYQEEEKHALTVNLIDRNGQPVTESASPILVQDLDHADNSYFFLAGGKVQLPRARYAVYAYIDTARAGQEPISSLMANPELNLTEDTVQTLDARDGKLVSAKPDDPAARGGIQQGTMISKIVDCACSLAVILGVDPRFAPIYLGTAPGTSSASFTFAQERQAFEPILELYSRTGKPFEIPADWMDAIPSGRGSLPAVYGADGSPAALANIDAKGKLVLVDFHKTTWEDLVAQVANVKAAGGKMVMLIVPQAESTVATSTSAADDANALALPTMYGSGWGPTVGRFLNLVKAGGAQASYISRSSPRQRYELAFGGTTKIDETQVHQVKTCDLVAVRTSYYDNVAGALHSYGAAAYFQGRWFNVEYFRPVRAGQQRTEYFTPGNWVLDEQAGPSNIATQSLELTAGHSYDIAWNKAVAGPTFQGTTGSGQYERPWVRRSGDTIDAILPMFGDSAGRARVATWMDTGSISLYRDGQLVGTANVPDSAVFDVPTADAAYRLEAEADRTAAWWPLWTKVNAAWTFRSASGNATLPLLTVRFDPAVDLRNLAPAGDFAFPAYVARQGADSVHVASLTVDVSYDDGHSWQAATVAAAGDHWQVRVNNPASGYASLRAKATDADANTVEQTVIRAYQIR